MRSEAIALVLMVAFGVMALGSDETKPTYPDGPRYSDMQKVGYEGVSVVYDSRNEPPGITAVFSRTKQDPEIFVKYSDVVVSLEEKDGSERVLKQKSPSEDIMMEAGTLGVNANGFYVFGRDVEFPLKVSILYKGQKLRFVVPK